MRGLVVIGVFDRSKVSSDGLDPIKGIENCRRPCVDSESRRNRYLAAPSRDIPLQDLQSLSLIREARYRELHHDCCRLLEDPRHWGDLSPMKAPSSAVRSAHHHCAGYLVLYLWACWVGNGIRWSWPCTSSIRVACCRNAPSVSHMKYRIGNERYYRQFENDNSIHVSSASILRDIISSDSASRSNIWLEVQLTLIERFIALPAPQNALGISSVHLK